MRSVVLMLFCSIIVIGASAEDAVVSVSVPLGDSLTLQTKVTEIHRDVIEWRFKEHLIARINSESDKKIVLVDPNRDRMELNNQTGNLKIRDVRLADCGLYKLEINGASGIWTKTFNVSGVSDAASDGVKAVSVLERDSVSLHTGRIPTADQINWRFKDTLIGQMNQTTGESAVYDDVLDGRFKDRLKLNALTGSLIITNIGPNISGLYEAEIRMSNRNYITHKTFNVTTIDAGNRLLVKEGTSVTLDSGFSTINKDYEMIWRFEHEDSAIAKISDKVLTTFDGADGRFRGSLELDSKTGSLTISNIKSKHTGLFHLDMTSSQHAIFKRFNLSVCPRTWSSFAKACLTVICVALLLLVLIVLGICCRLWKCQGFGSQPQNQKPYPLSDVEVIALD